MIKPFVQQHESIFKTPVQIFPVEDKVLLQQIVQDLYDTLYQLPEGVGVGLAAPQIGYDYNVFLIDVNEQRAKAKQSQAVPLAFWINAAYQPLNQDKVHDLEGCLSYLNKVGHRVPRYQSVMATGIKLAFHIDEQRIMIDDLLMDHQQQFDDYGARVLQHEMDHCLTTACPKFYFDHLANGIDDVEDLDFGIG